jgi:hypothetical protein
MARQHAADRTEAGDGNTNCGLSGHDGAFSLEEFADGLTRPV